MIARANKKPGTKKRFRTTAGQVVYWLFNALLPFVVLALVRANLTPLAYLLVFVSKWRVLAVRPHHWVANIRGNAVDLIVKLSTVALISQFSPELAFQLAFTIWYVFWLLLIKPRSGPFWVALQALAGLVVGLTALFYFADEVSELVIIAASWLIGLASARHFFSTYEEPSAKPYSYLWAFFIAQLAWLSYHWLLVYFFLPQIALVAGLLGYSGAALYHFYAAERLTRGLVRQYAVFTVIALAMILISSDWSGQV